MLVSDINDYCTENIVHPSKNVPTYCTKFAFLLKDNNSKNLHNIYSSVHTQHIYKSAKGMLSSGSEWLVPADVWRL